MSLISPINLNISKKLKNKEYFHKFFFLRTKAEIAGQIRGLRGKRNLKQSDLAVIADMKQSAISRIEQSDYAGWNFKTLIRIAESLDARIQVIFTPAEDVIKEYEENERIRWEEPSASGVVNVRSIESALVRREKSVKINENEMWERRKITRSTPNTSIKSRLPKRDMYEDNGANSRAGIKALSSI